MFCDDITSDSPNEIQICSIIKQDIYNKVISTPDFAVERVRARATTPLAFVAVLAFESKTCLVFVGSF